MNRFDEKTEKKLTRLITKMMPTMNQITEEEAIKKDKLIAIDLSRITAITAKTEEAKRLIAQFVDKDEFVRVGDIVDKLDYSIKGIEPENKCKYPMKDMAIILQFFYAMDQNDNGITIKMKNDYPITIENKHFTSITAPRVEA